MIQWIIIILLLTFIISRFLPVKGITSITSTEAKEIMKKPNVQCIDVRTEGEYGANHDRSFTNIPLHTLESEISQLKKDEPIILICQSGMRSKRAAKTLKKSGFTTIYNVRGGMAAWV